MGAIIGDFGKNDQGVNLFRINGTKQEIISAIDQIVELGCEVWQPYFFEKSHKHWSVLLKVYIPEITEEDQVESK